MEQPEMSTEERIKYLEAELARLKPKPTKRPGGHKKYYEANKATVIEKANARLKKLAAENPDKIKQYARAAYQRKKEKIRLLEEEKRKLEGEVAVAENI